MKTVIEQENEFLKDSIVSKSEQIEFGNSAGVLSIEGTFKNSNMNEETQTFIYEYDGFSFVLKIPDYWSRIYKGQPRKRLYGDYIIMLEYVRKVSKDKIIMDVGANHGIFSVPASMLGYKVIGFEPVESNFDNLREARVENNLVDFEMFNVALSNENGVKDIYVPECLDNASFSSDAAIANMKHKEYQVEKVFTVRFDDWIRDNPQYSNIGLIKIDAQGAEYLILEGMKEFLTNAHDIYLIVEFENHLMKLGHTYEELEALIVSFGFTPLGNITGGDRCYFKK